MLDTGYIFSNALHWLHVFPRMSQLTCFHTHTYFAAGHVSPSLTALSVFTWISAAEHNSFPFCASNTALIWGLVNLWEISTVTNRSVYFIITIRPFRRALKLVSSVKRTRILNSKLNGERWNTLTVLNWRPSLLVKINFQCCVKLTL